MTYLAQYRRGKRVSLGRAGVMTPQEARNEAKSILGDAMRGIDPVAAKREYKAHTLATFMEEEYGPWTAAHLKTAGANVKRIKSVFPNFLKCNLAEIEPYAVERWRTKRRKDGRKPVTINRDLACLKGALTKAVEWEFLAAHPLAKVKMEKIDNNPTPRYLTSEEADKLFAALDQRENRIRTERTGSIRSSVYD
jgi:site-specific recombinase XerD